MSDDYEIDFEQQCPKCGCEKSHYRDCSGLFCEEGYIDESENDPINFVPNESYTLCRECYGRGIEEWCPKCGHDYSKELYLKELLNQKP